MKNTKVHTKFKAGDWVICPKADAPMAVLIQDIDVKEREYIIKLFSRNQKAVISFKRENEFDLVTTENLLHKAKTLKVIMRQMRKEVKDAS